MFFLIRSELKIFTSIAADADTGTDAKIFANILGTAGDTRYRYKNSKYKNLKILIMQIVKLTSSESRLINLILILPILTNKQN